MFKISRRVDYAVRTMVVLGEEASSERMMSEVLAERAGVPEAFLRKIIADLSKAQLIQTFAGPNGGVVLARPTVKITMLDIFEAVEGSVCLNNCLLHPDACERMPTCSGYDFWVRLQDIIIQEMSQVTLDQLVEEAEFLREKPRCFTI